MSKEMRFWTILALFASIAGVWISYRQFLLAVEPKNKPSIQAVVQPKPQSQFAPPPKIEDFLSNEPSRYATIIIEGSNLELITFIDTYSIKMINDNIVVAETFSVWNGSIYNNHKYTIWQRKYNCREKSFTRLSERSYDEINILRLQIGPNDSFVFSVANETNTELDFVCMSESQRKFASVYLRYWRYLPDGADPVEVANRMFSAMGRRSGH